MKQIMVSFFAGLYVASAECACCRLEHFFLEIDSRGASEASVEIRAPTALTCMIV